MLPKGSHAVIINFMIEPLRGSLKAHFLIVLFYKYVVLSVF